MITFLKKAFPEKLKDKIKQTFLYQTKSLKERKSLAKKYLKGEGIEIGALHNPLRVGHLAKVKYVDRLSNQDLRKQYPQLDHLWFVPVDIIDHGELLATISNESLDFVIANHFIEHCQNPLLTLRNMFRVLKKGGILYIALPDKRFTFDRDRTLTSFEHLLKDYLDGPEISKEAHFEEWAQFVNKIQDPIKIKQKSQQLMERDYSIHFHVWTQIEMLEMFLKFSHEFDIHFDIESCLKNDIEFILILRKN